MLRPTTTERAADFWSDRQLQQADDAALAEYDLGSKADDAVIDQFDKLPIDCAQGRAIMLALDRGDYYSACEILLDARKVLRDEILAKLRKPSAPKFKNVSCSQCGQTFGSGNEGFSLCRDHIGRRAVRLWDEA
ncbi:hypothetical protein [Burkholderia metallica]|uniref:hypothetical protein n=1 Tax=Burkholderia metallica TaxID=488729 RepID=UPI000841D213|nr:hypothetical protein [Burkholderia metallica]AOJ31396.1 hypothetical protein WJ16_07680 [Burkholderia metallica]